MANRPTYEELEQKILSLERIISEHNSRGKENWDDITNHQKLEEALRESQLKFDNIFENVREVFYEVSVDGTVLDVSPSVERFAKGQYKREDLIGKPLFDLYVDYAERERYLEVLQEHDQVTDYEIKLRNFDGSIIDCSICSRMLRDGKGRPIKIIGSLIDITDRKRTEEALEKRMIALAQPLDSSDSITFDELFNLDDIQRLQDEFSDATGVASLITHPDGTPITSPSNFCRLCSEIIRKSEVGCANCLHSDALIGRACIEGPTLQTCLSGGLWDAGAGITVGGKHIANWLIGQVRDESQTEDKIRSYAREIGVDEIVAVEAFREVPTMSLEQFQKVSQVLFTLASQLSASAYQNVQQARFITDLKQAKNDIKRSEILHRKMLANIGDVIVIIDRDGINQYKSPNIEKWFGWKPEDVVGKDTLGNVHPEDLESTRLFIEKLSTKPNSVGTVECRYKCKDGSYKWIEFTGSNLLNDPDIQGLLGNYHDITEAKKASLALKSSEERYRQITKCVPDLIWTMDLSGRLTYANSAVERTRGWTVDEFLQLSYREVAPPQQVVKNAALIEEELKRAAQPGYDRSKILIFESEELRKDGSTFWAEVSGTFLWEENGKPVGIIGSTRDISERKKAEMERERLQVQLLQAQKMESVGQLAGGVAHDFNNMLGVILGRAELSLVELDPSQPIYTNLQEIQNAAKRSADLTRQLLAFARKQTIEPRVLDLNDTVNRMIIMLRRLIGEDISLAWLPGSTLKPVKVDPSQVDQVLANLCVNARDAITGMGKVTIETSMALLDASFCAVNVDCVPGEYVVLTVSDDGCGMDEDSLAHLFEPFYTTKALGEGTGLGLATIYGIVKQNKGVINVYSEPGHGSSFTIFFPVFTGEAGDTEALDKDEIPKGCGEMLLLVEDEVAFLDVTRKMLERLGYQVLIAASPQEAIRHFEVHSAEIQLMITDVVMPEMNGRNLAERLCRINSELKILYTSGYTDDVIAHHGVLEKGMNFLHKPFSSRDLANKVRAVLDGDLV